MLKSGPHYRFLVACLTGSRVEAASCLQHPSWDWNTLLAVAAEEQLLPTLHSAIPKTGLSDALPAEITAALASFHQLNQERNEALWKELSVVTRTLADAAIPCVLLKGVAYLAQGLFSAEEFGYRYLADIDLLLPLNNIEQAVSLLSAQGFLVDDKDRLGTARHHHPPLVRPGNIGIELHHKLGDGAMQRLLPAHLVCQNAKAVSYRNAAFRVPSPEHMAIHLIAHSQLHHPYTERIWPPLRAVYDLQRLRQYFGASLNWQGVEEAFATAHVAGIYRTHLRTIASISGDLIAYSKPTGSDHLRWLHRRLLWRWGWFRLLDPIYAWHVVLAPRLHFLLLAKSVPGAGKHMLKALFKVHFYRRIWTDMFHR